MLQLRFHLHINYSQRLIIVISAYFMYTLQNFNRGN